MAHVLKASAWRLRGKAYYNVSPSAMVSSENECVHSNTRIGPPHIAATIFAQSKRSRVKHLGKHVLVAVRLRLLAQLLLDLKWHKLGTDRAWLSRRGRGFMLELHLLLMPLVVDSASNMTQNCHELSSKETQS